jgi:hypothetical protein
MALAALFAAPRILTLLAPTFKASPGKKADF